MSMMWRAPCKLLVAGALVLGGAMAATATETSSPASNSTTIVALKLEASSPSLIPVRASFRADPPTIVIEFPSQRVIGALPEASIITKGVIQRIAADYEAGRQKPQRYLRAIRIVLTAPYTYRVRSESGHVIVEIDHPASVGTASYEVGVQGGAVLGGMMAPQISERFRAMQDALAKATPTPWAMQLDLSPEAVPPSASPSSAPAAGSAAKAAGVAPMPARPRIAVARPQPSTASRRQPPVGAIAAGLLMLMTAGWVWIVARGTVFGSWARPSFGAAKRIPSSVGFIDQLVWRAFERQGYQLVSEAAVPPQVVGTFRVIQKDGAKHALFVIGQTPFLEKRTVDQIIRAMHGANLEQGLLVASGAFTVPAQRAAKASRLTLIGREQLTELLGMGAAGEYVSKQLEQQQAQLQEAMATLRQYTEELETLRRQRNEASWYLGEERARLAGIETQLADVHRQLQQHQSELEHWREEAVKFRKDWEESEWYLGESRAQVRHLEGQVADLHATREALEARCTELAQGLDASRQREGELEQALSGVKQELAALRASGERRSHARVKIADAFVELFNGSTKPLSTGFVRDVNRVGIGLETDRELPSTVRFRLRMPGRDSIDSSAEMVWQRGKDQAQGYVSGFRFVDLPETAKTAIETVTGAASAPS